MRHASLEHVAKTLRRQIPLRRRRPQLQKAARHLKRNELSCRAGRHMRLRDRTSVEPLQKMIPEFAGELPGASISDFPPSFSVHPVLNLSAFRSGKVTDPNAPPENC